MMGGCAMEAQLGRWWQCVWYCMICMGVEWQYGGGMVGVPLWWLRVFHARVVECGQGRARVFVAAHRGAIT